MQQVQRHWKCKKPMATQGICQDYQFGIMKLNYYFDEFGYSDDETINWQLLKDGKPCTFDDQTEETKFEIAKELGII